MKKTALIFMLAVFIPALILGALAVRTASSQGVLIERQEADLRQQETEALASLVRAAMATEQQDFAETVNRLLSENSADDLSRRFDPVLREAWRPDVVGFSVTLDGLILSPASGAPDELAQGFLMSNSAFLGNRIEAEVYQAPVDMIAQIAPQAAYDADARRTPVQSAPQAPKPAAESRAVALAGEQSELREEEAFAAAEPKVTRREASAAPGRARSSELPTVSRELASRADKSEGKDLPDTYSNDAVQFRRKQQPLSTQRKVAPQKQVIQTSEPPASRLNVETSLFQQIVTTDNEGILSRFVQDRLEILFWVRPVSAPQFVFGVRLLPEDLHRLLYPLLKTGAVKSSGACLALLDDRARPFAKSEEAFTTDWKRPFVATEIGEVLPHWEAALYLLDPDQLQRSARLLNLILWSLTALALGAISWGGYMVVAETRHQMALVQKKTDFVSNVSHELKTPLTSIRMFAEMLHEGRVSDPGKRQKYLRVITLEADRLSRLINNVLDFARLERNQKRYHKRPLDLHAVVAKVWEAQEMHLQSEGFSTVWHDAPGPYPVIGDEDALAQVIVNLLSNAEKYSPDRKEIELHTYIMDQHVIVSALDRGLGVPKGEEEKIFESFYRAHDSLASGIAGSGLGLTLARRVAREHGGDIVCEPRAGGGSSFTLKLKIYEETHSAG